MTGEVTIIGGEYNSDIKSVNLALRTKVEVESGDNEYNQNLEYAKMPVAGGFSLQQGMRHSIPFQMPIPWEAPLTHMYGHPLRGTTVGIATELEVAGRSTRATSTPSPSTRCPRRSASSRRSPTSASSSATPTARRAASGASTRSCRSTRRSSSTRRASTRAASSSSK